ncbi:dTDP-4-dehydrorhamnose 3,5-epimerase [Sphingobium sp. C100]|uniref:dTDP-4-dehydrorhamnose 3,5-epimerase n=1 Tax=Sphingobium sp. C100 TaxID=1207055 RepID=UPI0003D61859|nr:dTDP-4-dehydrorhamnose 3,5-epimerase [Sphingobium sp. C100]ETI59483.1 dTDP-4-dehydrorhamnose 3,5-epimerase [Sphingobium sp. C100]PHQ64553.1 MAG: dTDP-4-dehydrorhamnose 3,5-epimerase [Sphingobium sp.]
MNIVETAIPGPLIIEPRIFGDDRGFFYESWNADSFQAAGLNLNFVQDNHSKSARGVLRGLHFQNPNPQGKLVRVVAGRVWDVAVDIRQSSPHFGKWVGVELSAANKRMFWVPEGFAHGFVALEDGTEFLYKCTAPYDAAAEHSLMWNDPAVGIEWPLEGIEPQLSGKDAQAKSLNEIEAFA